MSTLENIESNFQSFQDKHLKLIHEVLECSELLLLDGVNSKKHVSSRLRNLINNDPFCPLNATTYEGAQIRLLLISNLKSVLSQIEHALFDFHGMESRYTISSSMTQTINLLKDTIEEVEKGISHE